MPKSAKPTSLSQMVIKDVVVMVDLTDMLPPDRSLTYWRDGNADLKVRKKCRILEISINKTNVTDMFPQEINLDWNFRPKPLRQNSWIENLMGVMRLSWADFGLSKADSLPYLSVEFMMADRELVQSFNLCILSGSVLDITEGNGKTYRKPLTVQEFVEGPYGITPMLSFYDLSGDDSGGGRRKSKPTIESVMATHQPHGLTLN